MNDLVVRKPVLTGDIILPAKEGLNMLNGDWLKSQLATTIRTDEDGKLLSPLAVLKAEVGEISKSWEEFDEWRKGFSTQLDAAAAFAEGLLMKNVTPTTDPERPALSIDPDLSL